MSNDEVVGLSEDEIIDLCIEEIDDVLFRFLNNDTDVTYGGEFWDRVKDIIFEQWVEGMYYSLDNIWHGRDEHWGTFLGRMVEHFNVDKFGKKSNDTEIIQFWYWFKEAIDKIYVNQCWDCEEVMHLKNLMLAYWEVDEEENVVLFKNQNGEVPQDIFRNMVKTYQTLCFDLKFKETPTGLLNVQKEPYDNPLYFVFNYPEIWMDDLKDAIVNELYDFVQDQYHQGELWEFLDGALDEHEINGDLLMTFLEEYLDYDYLYAWVEDYVDFETMLYHQMSKDDWNELLENVTNHDEYSEEMKNEIKDWHNNLAIYPSLSLVYHQDHDKVLAGLVLDEDEKYLLLDFCHDIFI